jgi:hypothetical protein
MKCTKKILKLYASVSFGPGYREDTLGWLDPTAFIEAHRRGPEDDVGRIETH